MEKAMATHSSTLTWKIPWMEEPGTLRSMGLLGVRHDWSDLAAAAAVFIHKYTKHTLSLYSELRHFQSDSIDVIVISGSLILIIRIYYCCLVAKLRLTLCDPIGCSTPDFSVLQDVIRIEHNIC